MKLPPKPKSKQKVKRNNKVILLSLIALICLALTFFVSLWFLLPIAAILWINQRELLGKN